MNVLNSTTARLGKAPESITLPNGNTMGVTTAAISEWGPVGDGTYGNKTMWVTIYLTPAQMQYCTEHGITKGTAVTFCGRFDYAMTTSAKDGKQYLSVNVNPYYLVKAPGGMGGQCIANIGNVRLADDIKVGKNGVAYVNAAFDTMVHGKAETRWISLILNESVYNRCVQLKLKKGSHVDVSGAISIEQTSYNGTERINATLRVGNLSYAANAGRRDATAEGAPTTPASAPAAPTAPAAPAAPASAAPAAPATTPPATAPAMAPEVPADDFGFADMGNDEDPFAW